MNPHIDRYHPSRKKSVYFLQVGDEARVGKKITETFISLSYDENDLQQKATQKNVFSLTPERS